MAKMSELKDRVLRFLSAIENDVFDESRDMPLVVDGIATAHDAILPWLPKKAQATIDSGTEVYTLPDDVYDIEAVFNSSSGKIIPQLLFEPGSINYEDYWFPFPEGFITFNEEISSDYTLMYLTYWDKPESEEDLDSEDNIDPPSMVLPALTYFATAYVLMPDSVQTAEIRQWNVKADSGNPEHNPIEKMVMFLLSMFEKEMSSLPTYQRGRS